MSAAAYVVPPAPRASLPVIGQDARFPVRRIYCIGRNYVAHVREMGGDESRDLPLIFQKPADAVMQDGAVLPYPPLTDDYHFELELMVALKGGGRDLSRAAALEQVYGYGICLDMTRRRVLEAAQGPGIPWELKKAFDHSAPCGPIHPVEQVGHVDRGAIRLEVNGQVRQDATLDLMIWRTDEIIARLSRYFTLAPGDIIMTGTPAGVGAVLPGDVLVGSIEGLGQLRVTIGPSDTPG